MFGNSDDNENEIIIKNNTNLGENTLVDNKSNNNTAIGYSSISFNKNGYQNTGLGSLSLYNNIKGINNTSVGFKSLNQNISNSNTAVGAFSGSSLIDGKQNLFLGRNSEPSNINSINQIVIGSYAKGHQDNSVVIGNENIFLIEPGKSSKVNLGSLEYKFKDIHFSGDIFKNGSIYGTSDVSESGNNTFTGTNTFNTSLPTSTLTPAADTEFATKKYVDDNSGSGGSGLVAGAQTTITTDYNTGRIIGRDSDNQIDFATTDNNIAFKVNGADRLDLTDGALAPETDSQIDLGTSSLYFKDAYIDKITTSGVIELGSASDTTLSGSGGVLSVEGVNVSMVGGRTYCLNVKMDDISTSSSVYVVAPVAGTLTSMSSVISGTIVSSDATITAKVASQSDVVETLSIVEPGSTAGQVNSRVISSNNSVSAGNVIKLTTDGNSTNTVNAVFTLEITY